LSYFLLTLFMRKHILSLSLSILSFSSFAQKATIGLRGGVNAGWYKVGEKSIYDREYNYSACFLPFISVPVEIPVNSQFSIQPEANFIVKGLRSELLNTRMILKEKVKVSYVEIPVLAKLYLKNSGKVRTGFFIGPGLGYGLFGTAAVEVGPEGEKPDKIEKKVSFTEGMKRLDITLNAGANFVFERPDGNFIIDVRYQHGVSNNVRKSYFQVDPELTHFKSRGVIVSLGFSTKGK